MLIKIIAIEYLQFVCSKWNISILIAQHIVRWVIYARIRRAYVDGKLFKFGWENTINASHKHTRFCTIKKAFTTNSFNKRRKFLKFPLQMKSAFFACSFFSFNQKEDESAKAALQMRIIEVNPCIQLSPKKKRKRNVDQTIKVFNLFLKIWLLKFAAKNVLPYT